MGTLLHLTSHNYPLDYPPNAYVLWTFQLASHDESIVHHISYEYIHLGWGDFLKIGSGWDQNDSMSTIVNHLGYYYGDPNDLIITSRKIYIEFDADAYSEYRGFDISINALNISGEYSIFLYEMLY